jgi:hypothetical protein
MLHWTRYLLVPAEMRVLLAEGQEIMPTGQPGSSVAVAHSQRIAAMATKEYIVKRSKSGTLQERVALGMLDGGNI